MKADNIFQNFCLRVSLAVVSFDYIHLTSFFCISSINAPGTAFRARVFGCVLGVLGLGFFFLCKKAVFFNELGICKKPSRNSLCW